MYDPMLNVTYNHNITKELEALNFYIMMKKILDNNCENDTQQQSKIFSVYSTKGP